MRKNQRSSLIYYIVGAILLLAVGFVVFHDIPMNQEHIEEVIN